MAGDVMCFPLWSGPNESQPNPPIVIARVGEHYINLELDESCQIPKNHPQWSRYRSEIAAAWENIYLSRQRRYVEYNQNQ